MDIAIYKIHDSIVMTEQVIQIRTAVASDAEQIAMVHIQSWKEAYQGIIAQSFLDEMNVDDKIKYWTKILTNKSDDVFVAVSDRVVGFATVGKSREMDSYDAELYAIYILQVFQGQQIGRQLFQLAIRYLLDTGCRSMCVWVLEANSAKLFYEKLGGALIARKDISIDNLTYRELAYGWPDITALKAVCAGKRN